MAKKEETLEDILADNPWKEAVEKDWLGKLKAIAAHWEKHHTEPQKRFEFVLDKDRDFIFNKRRSKADDKKIHVELPPQPFIGDPNAHLWILSNNPGYSPVDHYDMLGTDPERVIKELQSEQKRKKVSELKISEKDFELAGEIGERQQALIDALNLQAPQTFYPMNGKIFQTLSEDAAIRGLQGTYQWWESKLGQFCTDRELNPLTGLFNLEFFPYHSGIFPVSPKAAENTEHYKHVVKELLKWAVEQTPPKILIVRSRSKWEATLKAVIPNYLKTGRAFFIKNPRIFSISEKNLGSFSRHLKGSAFEHLKRLLSELPKGS